MNHKTIQPKWPFVRWVMVLAMLVGLAAPLTNGPAQAQIQAQPQEPFIFHVVPDTGGDDDNSCEDWATVCELQDALGRAKPGDQIWVSEGRYIPTTTLALNATFQLPPGVAIYGGFAMTETLLEQRDFVKHVTVLSGDLEGNDTVDEHGVVTDTANIHGNNSYHVVTGSGVTATAVLDGFTITGGDAASGSGSGGGMYNDHGSPTLSNLIFSGNMGYSGGGMLNHNNSSPMLTHVLFTANTPRFTGIATGCGGGMANTNGSNPTLEDVIFDRNIAIEGTDGAGMCNGSSQPVLRNVVFINNSASWGGGIYNEYGGNPILENTTFISNTAIAGGGMYNRNNSNPVLTDTVFISNTAEYAGGMYNREHSSPILTNVTFRGNSAINQGGGMYNYDYSSPILTNITFSANSASQGSGVCNRENSSPALTNITFSGNTASDSGGGIYNDGSSEPVLTNVTFSQNAAPSGGGIFSEAGSNPILYNTLFVTGTAGSNCVGTPFDFNSTHNLSNDASCGISTTVSVSINLGILGDYGGSTQTVPLLGGSTAINAGHNAYCPATDQRGLPRPSPEGGKCDIGAFEVQITFPTIYLPLVMR